MMVMMMERCARTIVSVVLGSLQPVGPTLHFRQPVYLSLLLLQRIVLTRYILSVSPSVRPSHSVLIYCVYSLGHYVIKLFTTG